MPGDAGADLRATVAVTLAPGERALIPTGVWAAVPSGYALFVMPRSGLAVKHGVTVLNAPGVVDSGYRGEIMVPLINHDPQHSFQISAGDRIAQLVIMAVPEVEFNSVTELPTSDRGAAGFGSTGVSE
ncbi:dUTP diphosphatase [Canibacter sp. lx-45]|uniref:dUTP diphosphatase n=1 Tax=Canibacter zhuwentaonis TaxID=2837491 RepID=UPI001BDBDE7A|nr:dUTP diphosphatase [Canibacter zhuwentaonis]MBT1035137.1 dUTP diphosphatase [Canibacter zhuwentaonis]